MQQLLQLAQAPCEEMKHKSPLAIVETLLQCVGVEDLLKMYRFSVEELLQLVQ